MLLSLFGMILLCASVLLLFIPHAKWCSVPRDRDSKYSTASYFLGILKKLQINDFSKTYFLSNQFHTKVEKTGWQTMGQNTGKSAFLYDFNNFSKTGGGGVGCFIYSKTLRVRSWKIVT